MRKATITIQLPNRIEKNEIKLINITKISLNNSHKMNNQIKLIIMNF